MNAPCVPFGKYVTSKLRPFPWANCRIAGPVYTNFLLSTRPCAASRTNSKRKSTLQPTLHFGDVCDLENAKSLQNVRNAGEPDSLTPIRHPNTDLSTHRAYLRHKCTDTSFPYYRLQLAVKNGAGLRHALSKITNSALVASQAFPFAGTANLAKHVHILADSGIFFTRNFSADFRLAIPHSF